MGVVMKGGTSGNRTDALPQLPNSWAEQPVLDTDNSSPVPSSIVLCSEYARPQRHGQHQTPDFMPTYASIPEGSEDVAQQDINQQYGGLPADSKDPNGY